jgi:hypothetical protein
MNRLSIFNNKCAYMLACALTLAASGVQAGGAAVVAAEPAVASPVAKSFWSGVWGGVSLGQGTATYGLGLGFDTIDPQENLFGLKLPALGATGGLAAILATVGLQACNLTTPQPLSTATPASTLPKEPSAAATRRSLWPPHCKPKTWCQALAALAI